MGFIKTLLGIGLVVNVGVTAFSEPAELERPFRPYFEQHIKPRVVEFETLRIEALKNVRKRAIFCLFILFALIVLSIFVASRIDFDHSWLFWGNLAVFAIMVGVSYMPIMDFQTAKKDEIYPLVFKFFGDDFEYDSTGKITVKSLKDSGIIPNYTDEHAEDYVKGSYKGVGLEILEAELVTEHDDPDHGTSRHTEFKGIFLTLDMHKEFQGKTIALKDFTIGSWFLEKYKNLEKIHLEDPRFEEKFDVYSSDQVEARYLLTPSFMERLLALMGVFSSKGIQASFYDSKLLLMIPLKKDLFATSSIFEPVTFPKEIEFTLAEMVQVFKIIDTLKLYDKTKL